MDEMKNTGMESGAATPAAAPAVKPKKPTMQDEADRLFALQMSMKDRTKASDRTLLALFALVVFLLGALILILPDKTYSEQENRQLQTFPRIQSTFSGTFSERMKAGKFLDRYFKGTFEEDIGDYYADQFPARDLFVGLKGAVEIGLFKGENNDILLGADSYLLTRMDAPNLSNIEKNADFAKQFADKLAEEGIPVTFAAAGRSVDVMRSKLPAGFPTADLDAAWDALDTAAEGLDYVNLLNILLLKAEAGEDVMYRTDHHWTTLGAYYAYCAILENWGMEPMPLAFFTREQAADAFYGTTWRSAGMKWVKPDPIEFFRFDGDEDFTMKVNDTGAEFAGFYDRSYLEVTDKYSAFLSGNQAYETITKNGGENRPKLLLIKDSFGHSVAPFLAYHFDLEIVDMRYYKPSVLELVRETGCDRVLMLHNMDSLEESALLYPLAFGLDK